MSKELRIGRQTKKPVAEQYLWSVKIILSKTQAFQFGVMKPLTLAQLIDDLKVKKNG